MKANYIRILFSKIALIGLGLMVTSCANFSHNPGASRGLASAVEKENEDKQKLRSNFYKGLDYSEVNQAVFESVKKNY